MKKDSVFKNIKYSIMTYILNYGLKILLRTVFVKTLPIEYLGINSLLSEVVILLSVTEMGIGTAISYSLYKPLSENDIPMIKGIMSLLKKAYYYIGTTILIVGLGITPYLDFFIKDNTIVEIKYYFVFFLLTDAIGYFFSYKWILLIADQKQYIYNFYHCVFLSILTILQIFFLIFTNNYWSFILLMFFIKIWEFYFISQKTEEFYPYIRKLGNEKIDMITKRNIIKNTGALVLNKFANVINSTSANIIISKYIGLTIVGLYSNYTLIINAIGSFCEQIFKGIVASIGNMFVVDSEKEKLKNFLLIFFIVAWIGCSIVNVLLGVLNDFIFSWLGDNFVVNEIVVALMLILFYINFIQNVVRSFKEGAGLYWHERYRPIAECFFNILFSVVLVKFYGLAGILIANILSRLLTSFWIEPYILFNNAIKFSMMNYLKKYFEYTFAMLIIIFVNIFISNNFFVEISLINLLFKSSLIFIISNILWFVIFRKTEETQCLKIFIKNKLIQFFK